MEDLNAALDEIKNWTADRNADRETVANILSETAGSLRAAIDIWKDVQASPAEYAEGEMATMNMVGSERSKRLHAIGLDTIANKRKIFSMVGGEVEYYSGLQDSLVVEAYHQLKTGESLNDRANAAIETMEQRIGELEDLAKQAAA